jgi:hypothetical protein
MGFQGLTLSCAGLSGFLDLINKEIFILLDNVYFVCVGRHHCWAAGPLGLGF